jgi:hypothetical protein
MTKVIVLVILAFMLKRLMSRALIFIMMLFTPKQLMNFRQRPYYSPTTLPTPTAAGPSLMIVSLSLVIILPITITCNQGQLTIAVLHS